MVDLGELPTVKTSAVKVQRTGVWWATEAFTSIRTIIRSPVRAQVQPMPFEAGDVKVIFAYNYFGVISGKVQDGTTPVPGCEVWLFHRASRMPLRRGITNAAGEFSFTNLAKVTGVDYFAIAFPKEGVSYNAQIFDQITPV